MSVTQIVRPFFLLFEMVGLEAGIMMEVLIMIANLQILGVPVRLSSVPGTVSAAVGIALIPGLGVFMDRFASSTTGKAKILVSTSLLHTSGLVCVCYANIAGLLEQNNSTSPSKNSSVMSPVYPAFPGIPTYLDNSTDMTLDPFNVDSKLRVPRSAFRNMTQQLLLEDVQSTNAVIEEEAIPYYAILAMVGYALIDCGYDASNCFLKTFALACTPAKDHSSIIVKSVLTSAVGGCLICALSAFGAANSLTEGTSFDPNTALSTLASGLAAILVVMGLTSSLSTGFCWPARSKTDEESLLHKEETDYYGAASSTEHLFERSLVVSQRHNSSDASNFMEISKKKTLKNDNGGQSFTKRNKKLIILNIATFFFMGALYSFEVFSPNFVGVAIYSGDPQGGMGSPLYERYLEGQAEAGTGGLIFYLSFTVTTLFLEQALSKFGFRWVIVGTAATFGVLVLVLSLTHLIAVYYVTNVFMGVFRSVGFTVPYILANQFSLERSDNETSGMAMSLVAAMLPLAFTLTSAIMGPIIDITGDTGFPLYFSSAFAFLGLSVFAFLKV